MAFRNTLALSKSQTLTVLLTFWNDGYFPTSLAKLTKGYAQRQGGKRLSETRMWPHPQWAIKRLWMSSRGPSKSNKYRVLGHKIQAFPHSPSLVFVLGHEDLEMETIL